MSSFPNDPFLVYKRKGDRTDPFLPYNEPKQVYGGKVVLTEIPDKGNHVTVKDSNNISYAEIYSQATLSANNVYYVDYDRGIVFFDASKEGLQFTFSYLGIGGSYIPATRVYTQSANGTITQDVQDMIDNYNQLNGTDLYNLFDPQTGHKHTGGAGDAPAIDSQYVTYNNGSGTVSKVKDTLDSHAAQLADIVIDVKNYGAKGDGVTDDTVAMQAAHNTGKTVFYPKGTYKFTTLTIPSGGIVGHSRNGTQLFSTDISTNNVITFTGTNPALFEKFTLYAQTTKTSGSGIIFKPASGENVKSRINDVYMFQLPTCVYFSAASQWNIANSYFENYSVSGLLIENSNNADSGDGVVMGCILSAVKTTSNNIVYHSSGGLKLVGNKFLGGANSLLLDIKGTTSDLLITGNSFEGSVSSGITLQRTSGTATFKNIVIVGNQFLKPSYIIQTDHSGAFNNVTIESNSFTLDNTSSGNGVLLANVKDFTIGSNVFQGSAGQVAIYIDSACSNGKLLPNTYSGLSSLTNNSTSVYVSKTRQSGSSTATTSSAYGSMFTNTVTVPFPQPFLVIPKCWANLSSLVGGGVSVSVHNITVNDMQVSVIGFNNNASISFDWFADGII